MQALVFANAAVDEINIPKTLTDAAENTFNTNYEIDGFTFEGFDSSEAGEIKVYIKWIGEKVAKLYDITLMENGSALSPMAQALCLCHLYFADFGLFLPLISYKSMR